MRCTILRRKLYCFMPEINTASTRFGSKIWDPALLYARLIVAAAYSTATLITTIILWAMRTKRPNEKQMAAARAPPRNAQIAMLIEAGMLGYTFGRKSGHRIH